MATNTWTGATDTNYNTATNWDLGHKPAAGESVAFSGSVNCVMNEATAALASWDMTGYSGVLSSTGNIRIDNAADAVCLFAGGTHTWSGQLLLNPASTKTLSLTSAGKLATCTGLTINGSGNVSLQDNLAIAGTLTLIVGNIATNNYNISCAGFTANTAGTRSYNFGTSVITCSGDVNLGGTGLSISNTAYEFLLTGAGKGFTNTGTNIPYVNLHFTGSGSHYITTYGQAINKLIVDAPATQDTSLILNSSSITITTQFTLNGNSSINRLLVGSDSIGTRRTFTCNGTVSASYVDFTDIGAAGSANWDLSNITGGSGDCGNNSGITFTTAQTQTWNGTTGNWSNSALWTSRVPLPQDNVIIPNPGATGRTLTADMPRLGKDITVTNTNATNKPTLALTNQTNSIYGSLTLVSSTYITFSRSKSVRFICRSNATIITAGQTFYSATDVVIYATNSSTVTFGDNFTTEAPLILMAGTLSTDYNVTCSYRYDARNGTTTNMGSGTWTFLGLGGQGWQMQPTASVNAGTATISYTYTGTTTTVFVGGANTYNDIIITPGTGVLTFSGAFTFHDMKRSGAGTKTINFTKNTNYTMTGTDFFKPGASTDKFTLTGTGNGSSDAERWTLTNNTTRVDTDYLDITECKAAGSTVPFYAGAHSTTDDATNTGWTFTDPPPTGSAAWLTQLNQAVMGSPLAGSIL